MDINTVNAFEFYIQVEDGGQPTKQQKIFGPFFLNLTCDNNVIGPVLESSISESGETYIELVQSTFTTTEGLFEIHF